MAIEGPLDVAPFEDSDDVGLLGGASANEEASTTAGRPNIFKVQ